VAPGDRRRRRFGLVAALLFVALGATIVIPTLLRQMTDSFLFHPTRGQDRTPTAVGLRFSELRLVAEDGVVTQAWWVPYQGPPEQRLGVSVVTFHGNAGTMADRLEHTRLLHDLGVSVLTAEYRGYGDSEGKPGEEGMAADARAALAELRVRAEPRGDKVVIHGRSLGGAVAIRLAADRSADGLVVESTFTNLKEMAGRSGIPLATHLVAYDFDSLSKVRALDLPLLIVHGEADELIPVSMGRSLREAAAGPAELFTVPGGTHNDTWVRAGASYWNRLGTWLRQLGSESS
jgi:uncharacterized protein